MINSTPQVVTIAGSDCGGCAGLQADLKSFQARHAFGMSIIVALTAQNTQGVQASLPLPNDFVTDQFKSIADDYGVKACKTGMLATPELVKTVADNLKKYNFGPLVLDPVMIAKGGHPLLEKEAIDYLIRDLLPLAVIITPNLPEAEVLLERNIETDEDIIQAAKDLQGLGAKHIVIKGGHGRGDQSRDYVLLENSQAFWMESPRIDTENTHGTGDTFSACIAAELAKGSDPKQAIIIGKQYIQGAIEDGLHVGHGHGPVNHWAVLSNRVKLTPAGEAL